jgi:hypothetical protein
MRKLAILAGLAGAAAMAPTDQASAFPGGTQSVTATIAPKLQTVQYNQDRPQYYAPDRRHYARVPYVRRTVNGDLIDREGWRLKNGEWTSDCFRTLDYLGTDTACRR